MHRWRSAASPVRGNLQQDGFSILADVFGRQEIETLIEAIRTYLTIRIGQLSLSPAETAILVLTVAAALLSAYHLWRIGKQEDRRDQE